MRLAFSFEHFYFTWHGGVNYFRNLFNALTLAGGVDLVLFGGAKQSEELKKRFPSVQVVVSSMLDRGSVPWFIRSVIKKMLGRDVLFERLLLAHGVQALSHSIPLGKGSRIPCAAWIPDFQHLHLPHLCSQEELDRRNQGMNFLCDNADLVFVSSQDAANDLTTFSPATSPKVAVLRFSIPPLDQSQLLPKVDLLAKYGLEDGFMYIPNQFWAHKNHMVVVKAAALLRQAGLSVPMLVFTGAMEDYREGKSYSQTIVEAVRQAGLEDRLKFLGVVPYQDVMSLMAHCRALINPSLFEGWSTTVEEAKAMGKEMLLSSLPVHLEQAQTLASFFDPDSPKSLADLLSGKVPRVQTMPQGLDDVRQKFVQFGTTCRDALSRIVVAHVG